MYVVESSDQTRPDYMQIVMTGLDRTDKQRKRNEYLSAKCSEARRQQLYVDKNVCTYKFCTSIRMPFTFRSSTIKRNESKIGENCMPNERKRSPKASTEKNTDKLPKTFIISMMIFVGFGIGSECVWLLSAYEKHMVRVTFMPFPVSRLFVHTKQCSLTQFGPSETLSDHFPSRNRTIKTTKIVGKNPMNCTISRVHIDPRALPVRSY